MRTNICYFETELLEDVGQLGAVSVSTKIFRGENNPTIPVSSFSFSREEIFRNPGAQGDIFRAIGILPGVFMTDSENMIIYSTSRM